MHNYHLLVGRPLAWTLDDDHDPHLEILLDVRGVSYRAAINVRSKTPPHNLLFWQHNELVVPRRFAMPRKASLASLQNGAYNLRSRRLRHLSISYAKDRELVQRHVMQELPYHQAGPNNDLKDKLIPLIKNAIASQEARCYLWGELWGPEKQADPFFNFYPCRGIHNIHMNRGSTGKFACENRQRQDGALFIRLGKSWTAVFLAFSSQSWS